MSYLCCRERLQKSPLLKTFQGCRLEMSLPSFGRKSFATYAERRETAWREAASAAGTRQVSVSTPPPPPQPPPPPSHQNHTPPSTTREAGASCCATRVFPTNWFPQLLTSPWCSQNRRWQNYPLCRWRTQGTTP